MICNGLAAVIAKEMGLEGIGSWSIDMTSKLKDIHIDRIVAERVHKKLSEAWSLPEVARLLRVTRITIDAWRANHGLPTFKVGHFVAVDKDELEQWINNKRHVIPLVAKYCRRRSNSGLGRPASSQQRVSLRH